MTKKKLKFIATSDLHSDMNLMNAIDQYTTWDDIDFVILTGDVSDRPDDFKEIFETFKGKQIFMVPGNHETKSHTQALVENYNVHLVGESPVLVNDDLALFGTNYINVGPESVPEQTVFEKMVQNFSAVENAKFKIHLSHVPPEGTEIGDASPYYPFIGGSEAVRVFLENFTPDVTFVGHIHESSGLEEIVNKTKVINIAQTFKIFEFDNEKLELKEITASKKKTTKSKPKTKKKA